MLYFPFNVTIKLVISIWETKHPLFFVRSFHILIFFKHSLFGLTDLHVTIELTTDFSVSPSGSSVDFLSAVFPAYSWSQVSSDHTVNGSIRNCIQIMNISKYGLHTHSKFCIFNTCIYICKYCLDSKNIQLCVNVVMTSQWLPHALIICLLDYC